jgi:hypothetical protein
MRPIEISNDEFMFDFTDLASVRWVHASESSHQESGPHAMEYYIDDETIDRRFGHALDALLADWVDLALACYLADRLAMRKPARLGQSGKHWSRTLNITLPVRRLDRWSDEIQGSLSRLLSFLTDDSWKFDFVQRETGMRTAELQRFLFPFEHGSPTRVALYSGGLDSFAGAAQTLRESPEYNYILVSGVTNTRQQGAQRAQLNQLRLKTSADICHVAIPYGLHWAGINAERKEESSQRTRGFLFLTLGAVSAIAAGTKELFLYENGIGAINLGRKLERTIREPRIRQRSCGRRISLRLSPAKNSLLSIRSYSSQKQRCAGMLRCKNSLNCWRSLSLAMDSPSERRTEVNAAPARHAYCGDRPSNPLACRGTTRMAISTILLLRPSRAVTTNYMTFGL